jgi:hypothetical protein
MAQGVPEGVIAGWPPGGIGGSDNDGSNARRRARVLAAIFTTVVAMIAVEISGGPTATVCFRPFSRTALMVVQTIHGRRWNEQGRQWTIPVSKVTDLVDRLVASGESVQVNGKEWSLSNPLIPLFRSLPVRLRQPVYDALAHVLDGADGDRDWMAKLDQAHREHRPRRRAS